MSASDVRLVFVTAPDPATARELARTLVRERLAACANLVAGITSVYHWEGAVQEEGEVLLIFKTHAARLSAFESRLSELHPYEVPECVALAPVAVLPAYLAWLEDAVR